MFDIGFDDDDERQGMPCHNPQMGFACMTFAPFHECSTKQTTRYDNKCHPNPNILHTSQLKLRNTMLSTSRHRVVIKHIRSNSNRVGSIPQAHNSLKYAMGQYSDVTKLVPSSQGWELVKWLIDG